MLEEYKASAQAHINTISYCHYLRQRLGLMHHQHAPCILSSVTQRTLQSLGQKGWSQTNFQSWGFFLPGIYCSWRSSQVQSFSRRKCMTHLFFLISAAWHYTGTGLGNNRFHRYLGIQLMLVPGSGSTFATGKSSCRSLWVTQWGWRCPHPMTDQHKARVGTFKPFVNFDKAWNLFPHFSIPCQGF